MTRKGLGNMHEMVDQEVKAIMNRNNSAIIATHHNRQTQSVHPLIWQSRSYSMTSPVFPGSRSALVARLDPLCISGCCWAVAGPWCNAASGRWGDRSTGAGDSGCPVPPTGRCTTDTGTHMLDYYNNVVCHKHKWVGGYGETIRSFVCKINKLYH